MRQRHAQMRAQMGFEQIRGQSFLGNTAGKLPPEVDRKALDARACDSACQRKYGGEAALEGALLRRTCAVLWQVQTPVTRLTI